MDSRVANTLRLSFTGIALAGCQTGEDECGEAHGESLPGPPELVSAQMVGNELVQLTFTEPLAPVEGVNPASFRLSWAWYGQGYAGYDGYTAYYDPMALLCSGSDYCPGDYTDVVELRCAPDDPSSLILRLDSFSEFICRNINDLAQYYEGYTSPLLLHFDASIGTITDLDGEALESISPAFVTAPYYYLEVDGNFPNYPMRIPIECPPDQ